MIDFRYHLVSLISVFLALAVGIILGAGPLQDAIGNQLQGQVDQLRTERNDLRGQLDAANASLENSDEFIAAAGEHLVANSLPGRRVAIVDLDASDESRASAIAADFAAAGATVVAHVQLESRWTAASAERERKTVAAGLDDLLPSGTDTSPEQHLAAALVAALTQETEGTPGTLSPNAIQLADQLAQFNLVSFEGEQTQSADLILLISGNTSAPAETAMPTAGSDVVKETVAIQLDLAQAAQQSVEATLVAGPTPQSGDLISTIRSDNKTADLLSTVSGIESSPGMISVPLALASRIGGIVGHYGFEDGATSVFPPLPEPVATGEPATTSTNEG